MTISHKIRRDASNRMISSFGGEIIHFVSDRQRKNWENKMKKAKPITMILAYSCTRDKYLN